MKNFECTGKVANTSEYELPKSGLVAAKCLNIVDGRWVKNMYMGQDKGFVRKIFIIWEIAQEITKGQFAGENMTIVKEYTFAVGEKANLRKDLKSWRGKDFPVRENADGTITLMTKVKRQNEIIDVPFTLDMLVNTNCLLFIEHRETKTGKKYANISYILPFDKEKYDAVSLTHNNNYLPDWIMKKISERPLEPEVSDNQTASLQDDSTSNFADDDEVPF